MRVILVAGARPNFMKVAPVHRALSGRGIEPVLVHTGQHYDQEMSDVFLRDLGLPPPGAMLEVGSGTHGEQTAKVILRLEPFLRDPTPDVVVVVGDVNSTLGAALCAAKLDVPVAHVEAGLRSFDPTMTEELNRFLTDAISHTLLAPSPDGVANLRNEGVAEDRIFLVGNTMIDSLERLLPRAEHDPVASRLGVLGRPFLLATLHRPSNVDDEKAIGRLMEILDAAASVPILLVTHPRTQRRLAEFGLVDRAGGGDLRLLPPLGYLDFIALMRGATGVLTDSGGIQEETTVLGIPCITIRENTERPITITDGTNELAGVGRDRIIDGVGRMLRGEWKRGRRPDLWDGHAGERIADVLVERYG